MPEAQTSIGSEYNQNSFIGGMNLLLDDTQLNTNQYRIGFNMRNRYGRLDPIRSSVEDTLAPKGLKQEMVTFGNYEILFVAGKAYYKYYTHYPWTEIRGFSMSRTAPRYWTVEVPVAATNYLRMAASVSQGSATVASVSGTVIINNIAGASAGNLPGLLVQDNINQPQFIFINQYGIPEARITQNFDEWSITFDDADNTIVSVDGDKREYVPIGNSMAWVDGILYVVSPNGNLILRSVSGRPLDFVVNVTNLLVNAPPYTQIGGGDAYTTAYSVGVGGITTLRPMNDGSLFVAASNANFSVSKNMTQNAPQQFGEYTFIRRFLFNSVCLSDRAIFDTTGDTRFITLTGIRSFNAISQLQNEGRNSAFSANIKPAFGDDNNPIIQDASLAAGILFNDYEFYAVDTIFGPAIAVYDTINSCWSSFDLDQTKGAGVKLFTKIELTVQVLYVVTEDDRVFRLYSASKVDQAEIRGIGVCSNLLYGGENIKLANPKMETKCCEVRAILNYITDDCDITMDLYVNNRKSREGQYAKEVFYKNPLYPTVDEFHLADVDTQLANVLFSTPDSEQGWKSFCIFRWTNGSLTQFSMKLTDLKPANPLNSQGVGKSLTQPNNFNRDFRAAANVVNNQVILTDEDGNTLTDEDGIILTPDT